MTCKRCNLETSNTWDCECQYEKVDPMLRAKILAKLTPQELDPEMYSDSDSWGSTEVDGIDYDLNFWFDDCFSELLGSFGDNELSPECLDGAQRFLKEETGISIPVSYTSYIAPISSSKLHQEVSTARFQCSWTCVIFFRL